MHNPKKNTEDLPATRDRPRVDRGVFCLIGRGKQGKNFKPVGSRGVRFLPRAPRESSSGQIFGPHGLPRGLLRGLPPIFLRYEQIFEFQVSFQDFEVDFFVRPS